MRFLSILNISKRWLKRKHEYTLNAYDQMVEENTSQMSLAGFCMNWALRGNLHVATSHSKMD